MSRTLVVVLALGAGDLAPALGQLGIFDNLADVWVHRLDRDDDLGALGLCPTARVVLAPDELVALARPRALRSGLDTHADVTCIDGRVYVADAHGLLSRNGGTSSVRLNPQVPPAAASARPSLRAQRDAGVGRAGMAVVHVERGPGTDEVLGAWRQAVDTAYLGGPAHDVAVAEVDLLSSAPSIWPATVTWRGDGAVAGWADVTSGSLPTAVDLRGLEAHAAAEDASLDYISTRGVRDRVAIADLIERSGGVRAPMVPTAWADGAALGPHVLTWLRAVDPLGVRFPAPLDASVRAHLEAEDPAGLSRYARSLYWSRPDLQTSYAPDSSVASFATWLEREGVVPAPPATDGPEPVAASASGPARVLRGARRRVEQRLGGMPAAIATPRPAPSTADGVNVIGFLTAASGLGAAARATVEAVRDLDVAASAVDVSDRVYSPRVHEPLDAVAAGTPHDLTVAHLNPVELLGYAHDDLAWRLGADRTIGFWFWETDRLPEAWRSGMAIVDELWTGSQFLGRVFAQSSDLPVHVLPLPVHVPEVAVDRARFGVADDAFLVTYVCDAFSGLDRKNPHLAIEAFAAAFGDDPGAHLILKVGNLAAFPAWSARLHEAAGPNCTIIDGHLPYAEVHGLLAASDVYLSLHASEGYGLTVLEAMAHGVPAIATDHGGTTDLVVDGVSGLTVPYAMVPAAGGPAGLYGTGGSWAAPEVATASLLLSRLRADAHLREQLRDGALATAASRSPEAYAAVLLERLRACGLS